MYCNFYYDDGCGLCAALVRGLRPMDFLGRVRWTPYSSLESPPQGRSWVELDREACLETIDGRIYAGFEGVRRLVLRLPPLLPLAPLLWLPGMGQLGPMLYRWVARNRYRMPFRTIEAAQCRSW